jgi:hypothetical protein
MNHQAIYATHPNVVLIKENDPTECFDTNGDLVNIDQSLVDAWVDPNAYINQRMAEYPPWEAQLDKIYHKGIDVWKADIKKIKDKYPKPE